MKYSATIAGAGAGGGGDHRNDGENHRMWAACLLECDPTGCDERHDTLR
jgi:hypothetical protein